MKLSYSFIRLINWLYAVRTNLKKIRQRLELEQIPKEEMILLLEQQKKNLIILKEAISKKVFLMGIQKDFLANLKQIKKDYGIED